MRVTRVVVIALFALGIPAAVAEEIDRPGKGDWCYAPVRAPTQEERDAFITEVGAAVISAERKWGVPAPIIAAMSIVESGYGLTRLALKSNNILAFKWPGQTLARDAKPYVLWCQPDRDHGNVYPAFKSWADAIDFVAWRLKESSHYAAATSAYGKDVRAGIDVKIGATRWLTTIAPRYNYNPKRYIRDILGMVENPKGSQGDSLWGLRP
jgi:uncharacterized FlgJ-related protein